MTNTELLQIVNDYLNYYPEEAEGLTRLRQQLDDGQKLNDRRNFAGHIAGSGIVLSADHTKVLLIDHKSFKRWMQPGGHWESDEEANPLEAARREVMEETGLQRLEYVPIDPAQPFVPLHLETHFVAARPDKDEPDHYHHDFRYTFVADNESLHHQVAEVNGVGWYALNAPETASIATVMPKLRHFGLIT